jgi:hypothetical protein
MDAILDLTQRRSDTMQETQRANQDAAVERWKDEVGRPLYAEAKRLLPEIETAIRETYRPFVERLTVIATRHHLPTPQQRQLIDLLNLCDALPRQIRDGLAYWERTDYKALSLRSGEIDLTAWPSRAYHAKQGMKSALSALMALEQQKQQIESFLSRASWPTAATAQA